MKKFTIELIIYLLCLAVLNGLIWIGGFELAITASVAYAISRVIARVEITDNNEHDE
jgi:hypothetical protein